MNQDEFDPQHKFDPNKKDLCIRCGRPRVTWFHSGYDFCILDPISIIHGGKLHRFTSTLAARKAGFMIYVDGEKER